MFNQVLNIFFGKNIGDEDGDAIGDQLQQCMEPLEEESMPTNSKQMRRKRGRPTKKTFQQLAFKNAPTGGFHESPLYEINDKTSTSMSDSNQDSDDSSFSANVARRLRSTGRASSGHVGRPPKPELPERTRNGRFCRKDELPLGKQNEQTQIGNRGDLSKTGTTPMSHLSMDASVAAAYASAMRRSKRMKAVDVTKELIVLLPGDAPTDHLAIGDTEREEYCETFLLADESDQPLPGYHFGDVVPSKGNEAESSVERQISVDISEVHVPWFKPFPAYDQLLPRWESDFTNKQNKKSSVERTNSSKIKSCPLSTSMRNKGYRDGLRVLPLPSLSVMDNCYVDYDADSDDETFVGNLKQFQWGIPPSWVNDKEDGVRRNIHAGSNGEAALTLRCFEVMISALERELMHVLRFSSSIDRSRILLDQLSQDRHDATFRNNCIRSFINSSSSTKRNVTSSKNSKSGICKRIFRESLGNEVSGGTATLKMPLGSTVDGTAPIDKLGNRPFNTSSATRRRGRPPAYPKSGGESRARDAGSIQSGNIGSLSVKDQSNSDEDDYLGPFLTIGQLSSLVKRSSAVHLLTDCMANYWCPSAAKSTEIANTSGSITVKRKVGRPRKNSINENPEAVVNSPTCYQFSISELEVVEPICLAVYDYWVSKRSTVRSSFLRAYHSYMMDLWQQQTNLLPLIDGDFSSNSLDECYGSLLAMQNILAHRCTLMEAQVNQQTEEWNVLTSLNNKIDHILVMSPVDFLSDRDPLKQRTDTSRALPGRAAKRNLPDGIYTSSKRAAIEKSEWSMGSHLYNVWLSSGEQKNKDDDELAENMSVDADFVFPVLQEESQPQVNEPENGEAQTKRNYKNSSHKTLGSSLSVDGTDGEDEDAIFVDRNMSNRTVVQKLVSSPRKKSTVSGFANSNAEGPTKRGNKTRSRTEKSSVPDCSLRLLTTNR